MNGSRFIDVHGVATRYFDAGAGETVVLVHGGRMASPNCATDWDRNFDDLARDHRVIAPDMIGHGHTDNPDLEHDRYSIDSPAEHLFRFLDAMKVGPVHLVGHSGGAYQSTKFALAHPAMVKSLTIGDSGSFTQSGSTRSADIAAAGAEIADLRERYLFELGQTAYGHGLVSDAWIEDIMSFAATSKFRAAVAYMDEHGARVKDGHAADQPSVRAAIAGGGLAGLPVQVIWAFNDTNAPLERCGLPVMSLVLDSVPDSRAHVLNHSGHYVMRECPTEFNHLVRTLVSASAG